MSKKPTDNKKSPTVANLITKYAETAPKMNTTPYPEEAKPDNSFVGTMDYTERIEWELPKDSAVNVPVMPPAPGNLTGLTVQSDYIRTGSKRKYGGILSHQAANKYYTPKTSECSDVEFSSDDLDSIKKSMNVIKVNAVTTLVGLVVNVENEEENQIISIKCSGGQPFTGYIYDHGTDSYLARGVDFLDLGKFDFALKVSSSGSEEWSQLMPIPMDVLEKYFSPAQRKIIDGSLRSYPSPKYKISYIQMVD